MGGGAIGGGVTGNGSAVGAGGTGIGIGAGGGVAGGSLRISSGQNGQTALRSASYWCPLGHCR
jgi:hypothetical protein